MSFWSKLAALGTLGAGGVMTATGFGAPAGLALLGVGAGLSKHEFDDLPQQERETELAGETQRYAPWTGLKAQPISQPSAFGSAMQGGTTGLMLGQGLKNNTITGQSPGGGGSFGSGFGSAQAPTLGVNTNLGYSNGIPVVPPAWGSLMRNNY